MRPGLPVRLPAPLRRTLCATVLLLISGSWVARAQDCVGFLEHPLPLGGTNGAASVYSVDLDRDGDLDTITASFTADMVTWHENPRIGGDPDQSPWPIHVISTQADGPISVFAADINGDEWIDVLVASSHDDTIAWYQNLGSQDGHPPAFIRRVISRGAASARSVFAANMDFDPEDADRDNDVDVLVASFADDTLSWFENRLDQEGTVSFVEHVISTEAYGASAIAAADVDGDDRMDVVAASYLTDTVAWYESQPGTQYDEFGEPYEVIYFIEHPVTTTADGATAVFLANLDDGESIDVLVASAEDDTVAWYENVTGSGSDWTEHVLDTEADGAKSVHAAGEGDGLILLAASGRNDTVTWYKPDGGSPAGFSAWAVLEGITSVDAVFAADVDGDGEIDALYASSLPGPISAADRVAWVRNEPELEAEHLISGTARGARSVALADLDGDTDGRIDIVFADGTSTIGWLENRLHEQPPLWELHPILEGRQGASSVFVGDIDGDTIPDIVAALEDEDRIVWLENSGDASSFTEHTISDAADGVRSVFAFDLDDDQDLDVVSASYESDTIAWHENPRPDGDPDQSPWPIHVISTQADGPTSVCAADIDNDDHPDVISASFEDDKIAWYESDGLDTPGFTMHVIASDDEEEADYSADGAVAVAAADVDGDGRVDILAASSLDADIVWFDNEPDGEDSSQPVFTRRQINGLASLATSVGAAHLNGDDHLDVFSTANGGDSVIWYESDGADSEPPSFTAHAVASGAQNPAAAVAADFDGDDLVDLFVGFAFEMAWLEQVGERCGEFDANDDGRIDGTELSWLARAFGQVVESEVEWFADLDYNEDGVVDGDDLAILGSGGVWGMATDDCQYTCR